MPTQAKNNMWVRIEPEDLRWGVVGNTVRIQPTCLDLINKCQEDLDEMPWVVFLRTGRVGWVQEDLDDASFFEHPGQMLGSRVCGLNHVSVCTPDGPTCCM